MTPPTSPHVVPQTIASPTTLAEALVFYAAHKLPVTPVKPGEKKGRLKGWAANTTTTKVSAITRKRRNLDCPAPVSPVRGSDLS